MSTPAKTNSAGTPTFTFRGQTVTIRDSYYANGQSFYNLIMADGSIVLRIPQDSVAANPHSLNADAGKPSTL